jgi:uncharacterized integral membrane protein
VLKPKIVVVSVLALLLIIVVVQNSQVVEITLLFWRFEMSRVILILLTTMAGFICGYLVARLTSRRTSSS